MAKDFVAVKILDLPGSGGECACSSTPRGPEFIAALMQKCGELKETLEASYPGKTSVQFIDLTKSREEKETEPGQLLVNKKYPAPLDLRVLNSFPPCSPKKSGGCRRVRIMIIRGELNITTRRVARDDLIYHG